MTLCFDTSNLRFLRLFYHTFPNRDALRHTWVSLDEATALVQPAASNENNSNKPYRNVVGWVTAK
ncbi:MAG: hypothetical protein JWM99_1411 [Verrucomicrobiales bacterium]|nr:hypothetical protein [Verrucomicrobiales bacterium]